MIQKRRLSFILTCFFLFCFAKANASSGILFTSEHGLQNSLVNKVVETSDGMIWIATENGLCSFNGSSFRTYYHSDTNPNSIHSNFIRTLSADDNGHLLVGTTKGLQLYRSVTDDFVTIGKNARSSDGEMSNIADIYSLGNGRFIVVGNNNFEVTIDAKGKITTSQEVFSKLKYKGHRCIRDAKGYSWVACMFNGTFRLDKKGNVKEFFDTDGHKCKFIALANGPDGKVYGADVNGGLYVSTSNGRFALIPGSQAFSTIRDIKVIPGTNTLSLATDGDGVYCYECATHAFSRIVVSDPFNDISAQKVHSLCYTRDGDTWMALFQKGVYVNFLNAPRFNYVGNRSARFNSIGDKCVTSMLQLHDNNILVTTDNGGIYAIRPNGEPANIFMNGTRNHIPASVNGKTNGLAPLSALGLFQDSHERVWFGSYGSGYGMIDMKSGKCTYLGVAGSNDLVSNVYGFCEDKRGRIWVASMGNGLFYFDEAKKELVNVISDGYKNWACAIYYDHATDCLYLGTYGSLEVINLSKKDPFKHIKQLLASKVVHSISPYNKDAIVASTDNGMFIFNTRTGKEIHNAAIDALPKRSIFAALQGNDGALWVTSDNGLTRIGNEAINYNNNDGIQANEFYKNSMLLAKDGTMYFGGVDGITWFDPSHITVPSQSCKVRIVGFKTGEGRYITSEDDGTYSLDDDEKSFSFEFVTSPLSLTHRVIYSYQMDDDGWHNLPVTYNTLSYSLLSPGKHKFEVRAVINGKPSQITEITISIAYPWYRQWWAWIIWLSIIAAIGYIAWKLYRRRKLEAERIMEAARIEQAQEERLQFFINIAHDLRTPMTLIASPLQKLISTDLDAARQHTYEMMQRNVDRILNLINQLMDVRKIDRGKMQLQCERLSFSPFIRNIVMSVGDLASNKQQQLSVVEGKCSMKHGWLDVDFLEKIMLNLLGNSLKYTPDGGCIKVEWHTEKHNVKTDGEDAERTVTMLAITFTDNGIGIPEEEQEYIFGRFYQVKGHNQMAKGTGIGLNLVHSLVELHHGNISLKSGGNGMGTEFVVTLPIDKDAYLPEERKETSAKTFTYSSDGTETYVEGADSEIVENTEGAEPDNTDDGKSRGNKTSTRNTVLVVDDESEIRNYLTEEMSENYNVLTAADGVEALKVLQHERIDLVITDVMMPNMDGMELCKAIRSNVLFNHLPIIMLTAKNTDRDKMQSLDLNVEAFVAKPFNIVLLISSVDSLIRRHNHLRNAYSGKQLPNKQIDTPDVKSPDDRLLERVLKVINDNLSNPDITSDDIAREVGLSRVHLYRKLLELTNQTASNYIRNIRLTKGAELLQNKKMSISEVAYKVGFKTPNHFATAFKKMYGMTPSEFMKKKDNQE